MGTRENEASSEHGEDIYSATYGAIVAYDATQVEELAPYHTKSMS
jgi:hypothetical protein